jgi:adenylate cyclase
MEFCYPAQAPQLDTDLTGSTISDARRRLVTLVVMDVRDFTRMTRQVDDRLLAEVMGTWLRRAGEIIKEYGSSVDKYIGDAIMAAWVHSTSDQVPATELQVVLQAIQALSQMSRDLNDEFPLPFIFKVGVGVNTGQAMVGSIGKGDRPEYTVLGDTVNATFRLEKATKEVGVDVVLGVATAEGLGLPFPRYELTLKGYDQPTPFYGASYQELSGFLKELSQKA